MEGAKDPFWNVLNVMNPMKWVIPAPIETGPRSVHTGSPCCILSWTVCSTCCDTQGLRALFPQSLNPGNCFNKSQVSYYN